MCPQKRASSLKGVRFLNGINDISVGLAWPSNLAVFLGCLSLACSFVTIREGLSL